MRAEVIGIDHIYITASNLAASEFFYDRAMIEVLGFRKNRFTLAGDPHIQYFNRQFGFVLRPARASSKHDPYSPGLHHLCLRVESVAEVHAVAEQLRKLGIDTTQARLYPQYAPDYVATFFEDPDGVRLEVTNYRQERRDRHAHWAQSAAHPAEPDSTSGPPAKPFKGAGNYSGQNKSPSSSRMRGPRRFVETSPLHIGKYLKNSFLWLRRIGMIASIAALSACASVPKQALDQGAARKIEKIALVDARDPAKYTVLNFGHPGMLFGAIGGAAAGADMETKGTQFTGAVRTKGLDVAARLSEKIAQNLSRNGYQVHRAAAAWEQKDGKQVLNYKAIQTDADAILNVTPTMVGYVSTHGFNSYIPAVGVIAEMVGKNGSDVLYRELFMYGWEPSAGQWVHLPAPESSRFGSFQELMEHSAAAGAALIAGADAVSERVAKDFPMK